MGKAKRNKRHGGAARKAVDPGGSAAEKAGGQGPELSVEASGVLDGLVSLDATTRESSCVAIAGIFGNIENNDAARSASGEAGLALAQRLVAGGLIKRVLHRMVDRAPSVRVHAAGALRNISAMGDPRVCERMVRDDALTPILVQLDWLTHAPGGAENASKTGQPGGGLSPKQEVVVLNQLVATAANLFASSSAAVRRFTDQGGLPVLMRLLTAAGCLGSSEVVAGTLQALHVATDSNLALSRQLVETPGAVDGLLALVQGVDMPPMALSPSMRLQAAGILVNLAVVSDVWRTPEGELELGRRIPPLLLEHMRYDPTPLEATCRQLAQLRRGPAQAGEGQQGGGPVSERDAVPNGLRETGGGCVGQEGGGGGEGEQEAMEVDNAEGAATVGKGKKGQRAARGRQARLWQGRQDTAMDDSPQRGATHGAGGKEVDTDSRDPEAEARWAWKLGVAEPLKLAAEVLANLVSLAASPDGEDGEGDGEEEEEWDSDDEDAMERAAAELQASGGGVATAAAAAASGGAGARSSSLLQALVQAGALPRVMDSLGALLAPAPGGAVAGNGSAAGPGAGAPAAATGADAVAGGGDGDVLAAGAAAAGGGGGSGPLRLPAGTAADLADLRSTVALCAANLVTNLQPPEALGDPAALWARLCGLCGEAGDRAPSCVEPLTSIMWGLVQRVGGAVLTGAPPAPQEGASPPLPGASATATSAASAVAVAAPLPPLLQRLCDPEATPSFEARANSVGMVGVLGRGFGPGAGAAAAAAAVGGGGAGPAEEGLRRAQDVALARALASALEDPHVLVQAEALNAIMDVYGEDGRDEAFREAGVLAALRAAHGGFRAKVKQEGGALGRDVLCHLKETVLNASRFIKYKQQQT